MSSNPNNILMFPGEEELAQKQRIVDALMQQSLAPMDMPANNGAISKFSALAKILQSGIAAWASSKQRDSAKALETEKTNAFQSGMQNFMNNMQGESPRAPEDGMGPTYPGRPADPKRALVEALASRSPQVQALGHEMMRSKLLNPAKVDGPDWKTLAGMANPSDVLGNPADPSKWRPDPTKNIKETGGNFYAVNPDGIQRVGGQTWGEPFRDPRSQAMLQNELGSGKIQTVSAAPPAAPVVNVTNTPENKGLTKGLEVAWDHASKQFAKTQEVAANANEMLGQVDLLRNADKEGIFSNKPAAFIGWINNFAQALGVPVDQNKLGRSELHGSIVTDLWQRYIAQQAGGNRGVTADEAKQILQMLPQAEKSPEAREMIYQRLEDIARRQSEHGTLAAQAWERAVSSNSPGGFATELTKIYQPRPPKAANPASAATLSQTPNAPITQQQPLQVPLPAKGATAQPQPNVVDWKDYLQLLNQGAK